MSKIIEFPNKNHGQQQRPDFDGVSNSMLEAVKAMLLGKPETDLTSHASQLIWEKLARLLTYMEISRRAVDILTEAGFDPNSFAPDRESLDDFLVMEAEDYPVDEMDDPDNLLNGPYYDWRKTEDDIIRIATTVGFADENAAKVAFNILSLHRGDECWKVLINGDWLEGPEVDEFGFDPFEEDDWDDDDWDEDDEDWDDEDDEDWDEDEDEDDE